MFGSTAKLYFVYSGEFYVRRETAQLQVGALPEVSICDKRPHRRIRLTRSREALLKDKHLTLFSEKQDLLQLVSPCP